MPTAFPALVPSFGVWKHVASRISVSCSAAQECRGIVATRPTTLVQTCPPSSTLGNQWQGVSGQIYRPQQRSLHPFMSANLPVEILIPIQCTVFILHPSGTALLHLMDRYRIVSLACPLLVALTGTRYRTDHPSRQVPDLCLSSSGSRSQRSSVRLLALLASLVDPTLVE